MFAKILMGLTLAAMFTLPAMGQNRVATIDLHKVFESYYKKREAQAAIDKRKGDFDKELKGFAEDQKKLIEEYNKLLEAANNQALTPEERDKRKTAAKNKEVEIETSKNQIRTFQENAYEQLNLQVKRMLDNIIQDIRAAVNAKAKSAGYSMVIDTSAETANQTPIILYSNGENDLTEAIIAQINVGAPPSTSDTEKPADAGGKKTSP
jgi:Skp family chaperone for outer membrane proteins